MRRRRSTTRHAPARYVQRFTFTGPVTFYNSGVARPCICCTCTITRTGRRPTTGASGADVLHVLRGRTQVDCAARGRAATAGVFELRARDVREPQGGVRDGGDI